MEERVGICMEQAEVVRTHIRRIGSEGMRGLFVAPCHHHAAPLSFQCRQTVFCPIVCSVVVFQSGFRYTHRLPLFLCQQGQRYDIFFESLCIASVITVHSDEVYPFVARPSEQQPAPCVFIFRIHLGRDGIQDIVAVLLVSQIAHNKAPKRAELILGCGTAALPVP